MTPHPSAPRRRIGWLPMVVVGIVIGALVATVANFDGPLSGLGDLFGGDDFEVAGPVVVESVRNLSELTTVEVVESTTVEKGDDRGWLNFATGDRIFLFAVARISAGIDMGQVGPSDVTVDEEANAITLAVPGVQITSIEVDNEQTRVYDRDTGVFTGGDDDLERAARLAAEEIMVQAAVGDGLYSRAEESTELALVELLTSLGYDQVTIEFGPRPN